jgi:hypothetical protein
MKDFSKKPGKDWSVRPMGIKKRKVEILDLNKVSKHKTYQKFD